MAVEAARVVVQDFRVEAVQDFPGVPPDSRAEPGLVAQVCAVARHMGLVLVAMPAAVVTVAIMDMAGIMAAIAVAITVVADGAGADGASASDLALAGAGPTTVTAIP